MTSNSSTLARIAVRSTVWVSLGTYLNQIIGFVATLVMTRLLSREIFGFFALGLFWSTLLNLRPKTGLNYAAIQRPKTDGELLGTFYVLDLAAAAGSFVLSVIAAYVLLKIGYQHEVSAALIALMSAESIAALVSPLSMVLEKELQLSRLTLVSLGSALLAYIVAIALALSGAGIASLLAINTLVSILSLGGVVWVCRRRYPQAFTMRWRFDRDLARRLLRGGLPTGLSLSALTSIVTQYDNFLIGTFVGAGTLGLYDRAYRIAHWPNLLLTMIVARIGFLTFARVQDDLPRLTHAVRLSMWILLTLGIPMALVLYFGAPDIVEILYGARWSESASFLKYLTIYSLAWPFVNVGLWLSVAKAHGRATMMLTGAQAVAMIVISTPLTLWLGVGGTILGVMITMALAFGLSCYYVFRQVPLSLRETFGPSLTAGAIASVLLFCIGQTASWNSLAPAVRLFVVCMAGPGSFLLALFAMRRTEIIERAAYLRRALHSNQPTV